VPTECPRFTACAATYFKDWEVRFTQAAHVPRRHFIRKSTNSVCIYARLIFILEVSLTVWFYYIPYICKSMSDLQCCISLLSSTPSWLVEQPVSFSVYHSPPERRSTLTSPLDHRPKNISWLYPHKETALDTAYHTTDKITTAEHSSIDKVNTADVLKPTVSSIQRLQASALFSFRQNKHPQRDHHTSRRIPSSTRQTTHIHVQTTSKSTCCKGHYNPSIINLVRTSSIFKLRILWGTSGNLDITYIVCYHINLPSFSSLLLQTKYNTVNHTGSRLACKT
jgi:hypothetical protein